MEFGLLQLERKVCILEKKYLQLVESIRDAVRKSAMDVPVFREDGNGCIRILFYPCCKEADDQFGGLSKFGADGSDIADYEFAFAITPGGSRVIAADTDDGGECKVDCYAFSAMKIAHCSHAQDVGAGLLSGIVDDPSLTEDCGYGPYPGALCVEVKRVKTTSDTDGFRSYEDESDYCGIYVCVSGASSSEDLHCAAVAIDVIEDFFKYETGCYRIVAPNI